MIELAFLKELMLIRQANSGIDIFFTKKFYDKGFKFQLDVCNGCHDVLMMSMNLSDITILNIRGADYCCIVIGIDKSEATNLMQNMNLTKTSKTL